MKRGKQTCKILKEIRQQIAEANDIEFITSECQYQGDCLGTCPKCESEVRYLEQQLERKRLTGKAITILGISAGLVTMGSISSCTNKTNKGTEQEIIQDSITVVNDTLSEDILEGELDIPLVNKDSILTEPRSNSEKEAPRVTDLIGIIDVESVMGKVNTEQQLEDVLEVAPVMPEFPGGKDSLMHFIARNINYNNIAQGDIIGQGQVVIQFIIDKEGNIINPKVLHGIDPVLDKEALRVVGLMPKWKPAELADGTKVAVKYTIPVMFRLQ
ncbi:energy transducer TonB [Bacteroides faecalis]|nr:energy transducer TonB [Bacteroides faecalis]